MLAHNRHNRERTAAQPATRLPLGAKTILALAQGDSPPSLFRRGEKCTVESRQSTRHRAIDALSHISSRLHAIRLARVRAWQATRPGSVLGR
jgi:hypothetical protein